MSRGFDNLNPGNLKFTDAGWVGKVPEYLNTDPGRTFEQFETIEEGFRAQTRTLDTYREKYGERTVRQYVTRYAPASDNNDVNSYVQSVSQRMGVNPDAVIDTRDPSVMRSLQNAMTIHENGSNPYGLGPIDSGIKMAREGSIPGMDGRTAGAANGGSAAGGGRGGSNPFISSANAAEPTNAAQTAAEQTTNAQVIPIADKTLRQYLNAFQLLIGRPHSYTQMADPAGRVFQKHLTASAAPIVMIRPGRVVFSDNASNVAAQLKAFEGSRNSAGDRLLDPEDRYGSQSGVEGEAIRLLAKALQDKRFSSTVEPADQTFNRKTGRPVKAQLNDSNKRFFNFQADPGLYMDIVATMTSRIYGRLTGERWGSNLITESSTVDDYATNGGFFNFWADNATSVNESSQNDAGTSMLNDVIKTIAGASQQVSQATRSDVIPDLAGGVSQFLTGSDNYGTLDSISSAISGQQPLFPEYWRDSSFGRDYNISFKFTSPYGDVTSVYQNVLLPFCMILAFSLPIMSGPNSYGSPMICQFDAPGYFNCDLGIVTALSFVKGGAEGLWSSTGMPRSIEVTMTVKDLYPTLTASHNLTSLSLNPGLSSFLDNLGAIDLVHSGANMGLLDRLRTIVDNSVNAPGRFLETQQQELNKYFQSTAIGKNVPRETRLFGGGQ